MITECPCGRKKIEPVGNPSSRFLIIGDEPEDDDWNKSIPFGGKRGDVLYGELSRVGLQLAKARIIYVNQHSPDENCKGHMVDALREMKDKDGVLLVGAGTVLAFGLGSVGDLTGLCVTSPYFSHSAKFVMVTCQPPTGDFIGEFRLSIEKFAKRLKEVQNA